MRPHWSSALIGILAMAMVQQPLTPPRPSTTIMIAAVSRDESMLKGGIGPSKWTYKGTAAVEALAYLTPSGEFSELPCSISAESTTTGQRNCRQFAKVYLSKPHSYVVVSADGNGAAVHAAPTTLSECYDHSGTGTYSGADLRKSAIAASSAEFFSDSVPPKALDAGESAIARQALNALVPGRLDTTEEIRAFALRLEGQEMVVVQRTYPDIAKKRGRYKLIFAIGTLAGGQFQILNWKKNTEDEEETLLGTIALKNGREFLITVVSDPESHFFRVYGIRAGRVSMIYTGGGSSC